MQLLLRLQQNLAVNQLAITRNTERLPHGIANYYLSDRYSTSQSIEFLQQQIQQAQERLELFEPLQQPMAEIANILVKSSHFFADFQYQQLLIQWLWAVDQIGDINQPQEFIYRFATRLQCLLNSWESLYETYFQIQEIVSAGLQDEHRSLLQQFVEYWQALWCAIADLKNFDADLTVRDALLKLANLEINEEVNV